MKVTRRGFLTLVGTALIDAVIPNVVKAQLPVEDEIWDLYLKVYSVEENIKTIQLVEEVLQSQAKGLIPTNSCKLVQGKPSLTFICILTKLSNYQAPSKEFNSLYPNTGKSFAQYLWEKSADICVKMKNWKVQCNLSGCQLIFRAATEVFQEIDRAVGGFLTYAEKMQLAIAVVTVHISFRPTCSDLKEDAKKPPCFAALSSC